MIHRNINKARCGNLFNARLRNSGRNGSYRNLSSKGNGHIITLSLEDLSSAIVKSKPGSDETMEGRIIES